MAHDRLKELQDRLTQLEKYLVEEYDNLKPSQRYIDDLRLSINNCEAQIKQLTFARGNPLTMVNGAAI